METETFTRERQKTRLLFLSFLFLEKRLKKIITNGRKTDKKHNTLRSTPAKSGDDDD